MSSWQSYTEENGSDAWDVWELLKGHCKPDNSWEDARTEAGYLDSIYEGEGDDFDNDDYVWELLRDGCEVHAEDMGLAEDEPALDPPGKVNSTIADEWADTKRIFIEDILESEATNKDLLAALRDLSEAVFRFDCIERAEERHWIVTVLAEAGTDERRRLCGFICYKHSPAPKAELSIKLLAVSQQIKGCGYGTKLMQWFLDKAAHMPESECRWLTVSAWTSAVSFYERFDFCDFGAGDVESGDEDEEEQVWMELKNVPVETAAESTDRGVRFGFALNS